MKKRGYTLIELLMVIGFVCSIIVSLAIGIGILYIAVHFVTKYW